VSDLQRLLKGYTGLRESGIAYVFMGFVVRDRSSVVELTHYRGPTGALTTIGHGLFNYLSDFVKN